MKSILERGRETSQVMAILLSHIPLELTPGHHRKIHDCDYSQAMIYFRSDDSVASCNNTSPTDTGISTECRLLR